MKTTQGELIGKYCLRPQNFSWFIGAGASRASGLPTATDVIWYMKLRYYCQEEGQSIERQDIQNDAVRAKIQNYFDANGFPKLWSDEEYSTYFDKIFGEDKERQRNFMNSFLSEDKVRLSVGNRVLAALMVSDRARTVFTTNFDSVVEKSYAEICGRSIPAYHLEGSHAALQALNNEEYPLYCKLHGDFRYDSIKNLTEDLASQNEQLAACMTAAGNRFGFIVVGYSGRDQSIMRLFHNILEKDNPFPHGLFWLGIRRSSIHPAVETLLLAAKSKGIDAQYVEIETYDTFLLKLWRNIENKPENLDRNVQKSRLRQVDIPLPINGNTNPLIRLNALPITSLPTQTYKLEFASNMGWKELRDARHKSNTDIIFTKGSEIYCWGKQNDIKSTFGDNLTNISEVVLPTDISQPEHLHIKGFLEDALGKAFTVDRPLLSRSMRKGTTLIVDSQTDDLGALEPLFNAIGKSSGRIDGLVYTEPDKGWPQKQVFWAEAINITVDVKDDKYWLLLQPDIWIWPQKAKPLARDFINRRRSDRFNNKHDELLSAWVKVLMATEQKNTEISLPVFDKEESTGNPVFSVGSRSAYTRRGTA